MLQRVYARQASFGRKKDKLKAAEAKAEAPSASRSMVPWKVSRPANGAAAAAPTAEAGGGAVDGCAFARGSGGGPPIPRGGWLELADCASADCMPIAKTAGAGGGAISVGSSP